LIKFRKTPPERPAHPEQKRKPQQWDNVMWNDEQFIGMAAEALQEAMNVASVDMDANSLVSIAKEWSLLAETSSELKKKQPKIGFVKEEQD
jgi:hypothetical protein